MMLLCCTILICLIFILVLYLCYADVFLLCADAIDRIYDSDDDVPLPQMVLQRTIGVSNEDKDTEDNEDNESCEACVVMTEYLDDEDNKESKYKYVVTELRLYAYVRCTERPILS